MSQIEPTFDQVLERLKEQPWEKWFEGAVVEWLMSNGLTIASEYEGLVKAFNVAYDAQRRRIAKLEKALREVAEYGQETPTAAVEIAKAALEEKP